MLEHRHESKIRPDVWVHTVRNSSILPEKQYHTSSLETNSLLADLCPLARRADTTSGLGRSSPATLQTRGQSAPLLVGFCPRQTVMMGGEEGSTRPPRSPSSVACHGPGKAQLSHLESIELPTRHRGGEERWEGINTCCPNSKIRLGATEIKHA